MASTQPGSPPSEHTVAQVPVKPRFRGALHLVAFPLTLIAGVVLLFVAAGSATAQIGAAIFATSAAVLFGMSALYHRGTWDDRTRVVLRRFDHANIFLLIAGTYTPVALTVLSGTSRTVVLAVVWTGAIAGIVFRVLWISAPRWLYTPFYIGLGWVAVGALPQLSREGGAGLVALLIAGGIAYSAGGVVYALRRPDPAPHIFGYHEVFHACTLIGFTLHYGAVVVAIS